MTDMHWNSESLLPPVDCPLLIQVAGVAHKATRTGYIESKSANIEYVFDNGIKVIGRFRWTYP